MKNNNSVKALLNSFGLKFIILFILTFWNLTVVYSSDSDIDLKQIFSVFHFQKKTDLYKLKWSLVELGMEFAFDEIIVTDEKSEVLFKIGKEHYTNHKSPFISRLDESFVYFRIPSRAIYINRYFPPLFTSKYVYGIIIEVKGTPIISKDHEIIQNEFTSSPWNGFLIVEQPVSDDK